MIKEIKTIKQVVDIKKTYFCDICGKEPNYTQGRRIETCEICRRDICSACMNHHNDYTCCIECSEIGKKYRDEINRFHRKVVELNEQYQEFKIQKEKEWKEEVLKSLNKEMM